MAILTIPEERMSLHFAVFNLHVNDADKRADEEFVAQFGVEMFYEHIAPFYEEGIMSMFDADPTLHGLAWATLVTAYVNENRA